MLVTWGSRGPVRKAYGRDMPVSSFLPEMARKGLCCRNVQQWQERASLCQARAYRKRGREPSVVPYPKLHPVMEQGNLATCCRATAEVLRCTWQQIKPFVCLGEIKENQTAWFLHGFQLVHLFQVGKDIFPSQDPGGRRFAWYRRPRKEVQPHLPASVLPRSLACAFRNVMGWYKAESGIRAWTRSLVEQHDGAGCRAVGLE